MKIVVIGLLILVVLIIIKLANEGCKMIEDAKRILDKEKKKNHI